MAAAGLDLSFLHYVAARKGAASAAAREGAGYAYGGDVRVRATLARLRPVTLAVEATVRVWQSVERARMLTSAVRVTERQFPRVHALAARCAETLRIPLPAIYLVPAFGTMEARTLGTGDDVFIGLWPGMLDYLNEDQLLDTLGRECGHVQNEHATYLTTLYFLDKRGNQLLRWMAKPATVALSGWSRRAEITADRAGLLCTRSLDVTCKARLRVKLGVGKLSSELNVDEYLAQTEEAASGPSRIDELLSDHPHLGTRLKALRLFAQTTYFRSLIGERGAGPELSREECDAQVSELLSVVFR